MIGEPKSTNQANALVLRARKAVSDYNCSSNHTPDSTSGYLRPGHRTAVWFGNPEQSQTIPNLLPGRVTVRVSVFIFSNVRIWKEQRQLYLCACIMRSMGARPAAVRFATASSLLYNTGPTKEIHGWMDHRGLAGPRVHLSKESG